jgi:hypothetical protein
VPLTVVPRVAVLKTAISVVWLLPVQLLRYQLYCLFQRAVCLGVYITVGHKSILSLHKREYNYLHAKKDKTDKKKKRFESLAGHGPGRPQRSSALKFTPF